MATIPGSRALAALAAWLAPALAALCGWSAPALAADCGDGVAPCRCGDTVVASTTLTADIGGCPRAGLRLRAPAIVLDCNGRAVTGVRNGSRDNGEVGIHLDPGIGAEVRNCRVTGFRQGIRIGSGRDNRIIGNEVFGNRKYGIEIAGASTGNLIEGNRVGKPAGSGVTKAEEGIHNGTGSHRTVIRGNTVLDSKDENIYVLSSTGVQVLANSVAESDNAAIFLKNVHGALVAGNAVTHNSITIRGDSSANTLADNTIVSGKGYLLEAHRDEPGDPAPGYWRFPRRNTITGGWVKDPVVLPGTDPPIFPCLRFEGAYANRVSGLQLDPKCSPPSETPDGGQESVGNVLDVVPLR
jgi:parallel beta-helix repeat protein